MAPIRVTEAAIPELLVRMMEANSVGSLVAVLTETDRNIGFAPTTIQPTTDPWVR